MDTISPVVVIEPPNVTDVDRIVTVLPPTLPVAPTFKLSAIMPPVPSSVIVLVALTAALIAIAAA
jgi:hypothetical protein